MSLCKCNSSGEGARGTRQMLRWASLCISSYANEVKTFSAMPVPRSRSLALLPRPLCDWQSPFQCFYSIQGPARSNVHTAWDLRPTSLSLTTPKRPGEQQAVLREEAFNWPGALWVNTMFSGPVIRTKKQMPCFNLCPQAKREGCMWCWRFNREQRFRWSIWRRWESRRQLSRLEERPASLSLTSDAIFMCCNSQRWAYTVLGGPAWVCWSRHHLEQESLWPCVCVCVFVSEPTWTCVNIWGCLLVLTCTSLTVISTACRLSRRLKF